VVDQTDRAEKGGIMSTYLVVRTYLKSDKTHHDNYSAHDSLEYARKDYKECLERGDIYSVSLSQVIQSTDYEEYTNDPSEDLYSGLLKDDIEVKLCRDGQEWLIDVKDHKTDNYVEGYVEELFTKAKERYDYLVKKYDQKEYPFKEGDGYWTIENDEYGGDKIVWYCWDGISEELHDYNPYGVYYRTEDEAKTALEEGAEKVYCTNGTLV
jgi:hypothetical protein